jgi:hypothetical protein
LPMIFPSLGSSKPRAALNNWDINHQTIKKNINISTERLLSHQQRYSEYVFIWSYELWLLWITEFFFGCLPTSPGVTSWCHHLFGGP